jgi:hypothetical protein
MRVLPASALVCAAVAGARPAAADPSDAAFYPRLSAGAGIGDRIGDVVDVHPSGLDLHTEVAARLTPEVHALATWDGAWVTTHEPMLLAQLSGFVSAPALGLRDVLMSFGQSPTTLGGDLVVEAVVGREHTRWDGGGALTRTFFGFGVGGSIALPRRDAAMFQRIRYGFRMDVARAPDAGKVPFACDGPCDQLTQTRPYDLTMTLEISWLLGR